MHITSQKQAVRDNIAYRIKNLSATDHAAESRSICKQIANRYPNCKAVCAYYPLKSEVDIRPILQAYLENNIEVYLPAFEGKFFTFRKIKSLKDLFTGPLNIPQPYPDAPKYNPEEIDVMILPARACDRHGNRLGRGNGGYDRLIGKLQPNCPTMICPIFECQLLNKIPTEPHDQPVDEVVMAREILC